MADLDDFFAKKDRKKKTNKKFTTADELSKILDDTKIKTNNDTKPKKDKADGDDGARGGDEEEWREYEEEVKDYSGLKIQVLTATHNSGNESATSGDEGSDSNQGAKGPWKKADSAGEEQQKPVAETPAPAAKAETPGKYIPAPMRKQMNMESNMNKKIQSKYAPDITNADYFPELGANSRRNNPALGNNAWSQPTNAVPAPTQQITTRLQVGNRFNTLSES